MTTGDIKNNIRKLIGELKQVSYDIKLIDFDAVIHGIPSAFLPIIHHVLLDFSSDLASFFARKDYELYARTDLRFVETVYKILLQEFSYKPSLTKQQFLALGFAERKIILLTDIVKLCREKHKSISKKKPIKFSYTSSKNATKLSTAQGNTIISSKNPDTIVKEVDSHIERKAADNCFLEQNPPLLSKKGDGNSTKDEVTSTSLIELPSIENVKVSKGLPLPNLSATSWTTKSDTRTTIPKPCDSLAVTPLREVENGVDTSVEKSRADVLDIEYIEPNGFKVVKHDTTMNGKDLEYDKQDGSRRDDTVNPGDQSSMERLDLAVSNQSESAMASSSEHRCKCNHHQVVETLQKQMIYLQSSLKNLVTMSNELFARVVLLETQNRLMEKKIESINLASNIDIDEDLSGLAATKEYTSRQLRSNRKFMSDEWDDASSPQSRVAVQYSPERYADVENSLPEDFEPINEQLIAEMNNNEMNSKEVFSNPKHEKAVGKGSRDMLVAEEKKAEHEGGINQEVISTEDEMVLSPLHEGEFSFMEEDTRATVKNLQRKLEETMKLFQMQTNITQL